MNHNRFFGQSLDRGKLGAVALSALLAGSLLTACGSSAADEVPVTVTSTMTASPTTVSTTVTETVTKVSTVTETVTEEPVPAGDIDVSGAGADALVNENPPVIAGFAAVPEPAPAPAPAPVPAPQQSTYFQNCSAARAAGAAPVYRGNPGYGSHLDRDGDGVGCE
ncbi:excalibur calcium-binding domain-containing protein [Corynebacterium guangdongense]|uniref:Excalibur calcium-binding domain-containing protein n=1 Tax=Corynebacterium guangdongense TaxID=1783348 RepID=A0ABU1ZYD9_9CORY|nr:excalibur calcium-binding domain-containing protein [Corynebacterium guangdongense]MDR7329860.1 hypothetical protein [Corynebacterium guangdongense]